MEDTYDVVILGTGLTECILSGLLSTSGKKVLHMDKNPYYGGESASLSPLTDLFKHFGDGTAVDEKIWGRDRDWNVDLVPKFIMANGELTKLLIKSNVTKYLEFKQIEGSYVFKRDGKHGKLHKVPASDKEALSTSLMGLFEKRRFASLLRWAIGYDFEDAKTWDGVEHEKSSMAEVYKKFGVDKNTQDFTGHAILLYTTDDYIGLPSCTAAIKALQLYYQSLSSYGKSPYLYPLYGLGELPQGFARLSAVYGGTYMLDRKGEIQYDAEGAVTGVKYLEETAKTEAVICDPTYFPEECDLSQEIIRAICILEHPIPTINEASVQIIVPQNQVDRKNDIYIGMLSHANQVCPEKFYLAFVSTTKEKDSSTTPEAAEEELRPALELLGVIKKKYVFIQKLYTPKPRSEPAATMKGVYISESYDATTHFESVCQNIKNIYQDITGEVIDFDKISSTIEEP